MEVLRTGGELVGHTSLDPDWDPAIEWTRLAGLRTLGIWAPESQAERAIEALWHSELGEPFMRGFRVTLADRTGAAWHEDFSIRYFAEAARASSAGDPYLYRALAYEPDTAETPDEPALFATVDRPQPLVFHDVPPAVHAGALPQRADAHAGDFEVYIPRAVLDDASTLTAGAGDVETGGILIGHLGREVDATQAAGAEPRSDTRPSEICVAITALIPARHTVGHSVKLTFTSDTWTDVRRAVALRGRGELVLGWFHSHPQQAWCREKGCSLAAQQQCPSAAGFFSADDGALHRTVFPRAFTVALVMTHSAQGIIPRLFGWRAGLLESRGYSILAQPLLIVERLHATPIAV
jgi:proteasome lid subunit RPN8/RPN11